MPYDYRAFGLTFRSDRPIPSLAGTQFVATDDVDVEIMEGVVPPPNNPVAVSDMLVGVSDGEIVLSIAEAGIYRVTDGRQITVERETGARPEEVDSYLLGSVFGALLHQRSILPLHGNAVVIDGRAFLFCGDSGAGKSTLAAYFQSRGHGLLTDDLCAVRLAADGMPMVSPGIARLKLWQQSLSHFSRSSAGLATVPWSDGKFELPMENIVSGGPYPIAAIYHLREAEDGRLPGIHLLKGLDAANALTANIYRRRLADLMGRGAGYLTMAAQIMRTTPVHSMNRVWGLENFDGEAELMARHVGDFADRAHTP